MKTSEGAIDHLQDEDEMPKSATISVVEIEGKKFVAGLFWQPLTKPRTYKKEAQEIGKREGMEIVAIRRSTIMQAGFAPKGQGAIKGMYSLAAALAGKLGKSWIGVFAVGNGNYAFVAVDDGAIVPGCDVIGDHEDIEQRLRYVYGRFRWDKVYAPKDFDFGGEQSNISELLSNNSFTGGEWGEFRLQPLKFGLAAREIASYVVIGLAVVAVGLGFMKYKENEARKERLIKLRAELIRKAELEKIKANTKQEKVVKGLDHPWIKMASVEDFTKGCESSINSFPLSLGGWIFESAACDGNNVTASYKRRGTVTANDLIIGVKGRFENPPAFTSDFESASITVPVKILLGGDDVLDMSAEVLPAVSSVFQGFGIRMKFTEKSAAPKAALLPGQQQPVEPEVQEVPDWKGYTFMVDSEIAPSTIFFRHAWTGMRLNKIGVKLAPETVKLIWIIEGEQYAK